MVRRVTGRAHETTPIQQIHYNSCGTVKPSLIYQRINSAKDEIRLIRLAPASLGEPIQCSLFNTPRASAPPYKALSYAWGHLIASDPILINSDPFLVTRNLRNALLRLRPKTGEQSLILWIDSICINQDDIQERGLQIAKMRSIYRDASSVLVFLGLEHHGSAEALKFVRDLHSSHEAEVTALLSGESGKRLLTALVSLFRRRYFWRIWVIQEVHYAKSAVVYCGDEEISWDALDCLCDILAQQESNVRAILYDSPGWIHTLLRGGPRSLQLSRYSCSRTSYPPLLELLLSHKSKDSTDPKDKVYALVGISSSKATFGHIDYSLSVRELFTNTARHIISTSKKLDVICVKSHNYNDHNLPTWAPDWTRSPRKVDGGHKYTLQGLVGLQHCQTKFNAAGRSEARVEFLKDGYILKATGITISKISQLANAFRQRGPQNQAIPALEAAHNWWNVFTVNRGTSKSAREKFSRVISCGDWKPSEYKRKLSALLSLFETHLPHVSSGESDSNGKESTRIGLEALVSASQLMNGRRLFISESNTVGLAPWDSREGDILCVLLGCRFPVVLRKEDGKYILIGEAYVENFMHGEALVGVEEVGLESFEIC